MTAAVHDIIIEEGATFNRVLTVRQAAIPADPATGSPEVPAQAIDLTGYTGRGEIRKDYVAASPVLETFTINITDAANGVFKVSLTAAQTASLVSDATRDADYYSGEFSDVDKNVQIGYYDIELDDGTGFITRLIKGRVYFSDEITR